MNLTQIRNILNAIFILMTAACIIIYFASNNWSLFAYTCGFAVVIKMVESVLRLTDNRKNKE